MGLEIDWKQISLWIHKSEMIFIKKLSRNDVSWADDSKNGHQNGFFIPKEIAKSGFFPELKNTNPEKPHIFDVCYRTLWPASGELKESSIKYFSKRNPGNPEKEKPRNEWQHTGMCKEQFRGLSPASLLLVGKLKNEISGAYYWFIVVDSLSAEAEIIESLLELDASFHFGLFNPSELKARKITDSFVNELICAINGNKLREFINKQKIPQSDELAKKAQKQWLKENGLNNMNPFSIDEPGDAVMRISRDIEYSLYKRAEVQYRAAQVAEILLQGNNIVENIVENFYKLDAIFISAAQTRKSRAGLSFENHVKRLFLDGQIKHEAQAVFGGRRPDFVLPDVKTLNEKGDAIIVSLKTTLRERWKQLSLEKPLGTVFLATVDDRVSGEAIAEMGRHKIALVVPESLKKSKESVYGLYDGVITFRDFFDCEIQKNRPSLIIPFGS